MKDSARWGELREGCVGLQLDRESSPPWSDLKKKNFNLCYSFLLGLEVVRPPVKKEDHR